MPGQHDVPLIAGMTDNEGSLFRSRFEIEGVADFESYVQADFGGVAAEMLGYYDVATADAVTPGLNHLVHDMFFAGPVRVQVRAHGDVSSPAWLYLFAQVPPTQMGSMFGAHHASELSYVFGTMAAAAGCHVDRRRPSSIGPDDGLLDRVRCERGSESRRASRVAIVRGCHGQVPGR